MGTTVTASCEIFDRKRHDYNNPALNTYAMVKARFEKECFELREPFFCYVRILNGDTTNPPQVHSRTTMQQYYCDWSYWKETAGDKHVKQRFAPRWLKDSKRRVVDHMEIRKPKGFRRKLAPWRGW